MTRDERTPSPGERGFTLVEVLVGGAVGIIGLFASLSLVLAALHGNSERRDALAAEQLAEHLLATMQAEATMWHKEAKDTPGKFIKLLPTPEVPGQGTGWLLVPGTPFSQDKRIGPLGSDDQWYDAGILQYVRKERGTRYCAHWRLTWVTPELVRAEVRVAWSRSRVDADKYMQCPADMAYDVGNTGSITLPAMVTKNVYVQ